MPKDFSLHNMVKDLFYIANPTFVHEWLFKIAPLRPGLTMLEPGCGAGKFGLAYSIRGVAAYMFDIDDEVVRYATRLKLALGVLLARELAATIYIGDLFQVRTDTAFKYDLVFAEGTAQHWTDERRQGCIDRMAAWCKPGGIVAIAGNNGLLPHEQEADNSFRFTYQGMPPKRKCFSPTELEERMEKAGLVDVRMEPLGGTWENAPLIGGDGRKVGV